MMNELLSTGVVMPSATSVAPSVYVPGVPRVQSWKVVSPYNKLGTQFVSVPGPDATLSVTWDASVCSTQPLWSSSTNVGAG